MKVEFMILQVRGNFSPKTSIFSLANSLPNSGKKPKHKKQKEFDILSEVKQWISNEISTLCLNAQDDKDVDSQLLLNVDDDHPLYPLMEIINNYTKGVTGKKAMANDF